MGNIGNERWTKVNKGDCHLYLDPYNNVVIAEISA